MSSSPANVHPASAASPMPGDTAHHRWLFLLLAALALAYAFFAGLRTVSDFDLGWQMATGRWVVQHHAIPSTDILSYTAAGQTWIYPIGAGVLFYLAYLAGGWVVLSWIGAAACVGTVAILLRKNSAAGAAIAILAVPVIATRTTPRADMFSVVIFAAMLSILWEQHRFGTARLWLLPLLTFAWVNLHIGFIAGLALLAAYAGSEVLDTIHAAKRQAAIARLRRSAPWLAASAVVTLANPWGWALYPAMTLQEKVNKPARIFIAEWTGLPLSWSAFVNSLSFRQASGALYLLVVVAIVAAAFALLREDWGAAILLLGATGVGVKYVRLAAVVACVVVIVAGPILSDAIALAAARMRRRGARTLLRGVTAGIFGALVLMRCFDLATNRFYLRGSSVSTFGAGLSWWFPERAAAFIEGHDIPGEIFSGYNHGGFFSWRLGPQRRDTMDGRTAVFGIPAILSNRSLLQTSPDSSIWQDEAKLRNENAILLPLARFNGIELTKLSDFCTSQQWQPVYLDEVSALFVRREAVQARNVQAVDCATAPFPAVAPHTKDEQAFNAWSNAASVLNALGRNDEALAAANHALDIFPDSSFVHWQLGNLFATAGRRTEAEDEYRRAIELEPSDVTWAALASFYRSLNRTQDAIDAMQRAASLSARPYSLLSELGYLYLKAHQPAAALAAFERAERSAPAGLNAGDHGTFDFMIAQGRSVAWSEHGDMSKAIAYQEQATRVLPDSPDPWMRLAKLYQRAGRGEDAVAAEVHASAARDRQK